MNIYVVLVENRSLEHHMPQSVQLRKLKRSFREQETGEALSVSMTSNINTVNDGE